MPEAETFEELQQQQWAEKLGHKLGQRIVLDPGEGAAKDYPAPVPDVIDIQKGSGYALPPAAAAGLGFENLVEVAAFVYPDLILSPWQKEELYRVSGHLDGKPTSPKVEFDKDNPFLATYICANGSGKDKILISIIAIGLCLIYRNTNVVITSASFDQLKYQTENHINHAIAALNERAGTKVFESVSMYHSCAATSGWIKLFATDQPGRAEGWHPDTESGKLVILLNEVKTIDNALLDAFDRCHGFSYRIEVSSPGPRRGVLFNNWKASIKYPALPQPFKYFGRRITGDQCPHLNPKILDLLISKHGLNHFITQTSWFANFWEEETGVVIPAGMVDDCEDVEHTDGPLGIGLDAAAGGDETVLVLRRGNHLVDLFAFTESNLVTAAGLIDSRLDAYRFQDYVFNADDGGVGRGLLDNLAKLGWVISRRHMQSVAYDKSRFANLAAELYWHVRDLFQARLIPKPLDETLYTQLITRRIGVSEGTGKHKLDSKKRIKELGGSSPDRSDAYCLAFYSFRPKMGERVRLEAPDNEGPFFSLTDPRQLQAFLRRNTVTFLDPAVTPVTGRPTDMRLGSIPARLT